MRIALLNRPPSTIGGDHIALRATLAALRRAGVEAEQIWGADLKRLLPSFDLAHVYHIDFDFCRENFDAVYSAGIPYVVTPIYYPEITGVAYSEKLEALRFAKAVLPFSRRETNELTSEFGSLPITPIPNGTDPVFHAEPTTDRVGVCTSDWGCTKGSGLIERACTSLGIPFACARDIPHAQMPEFYRRRLVYASASRSDRMSLSVGEALCSGCRVIASDANRGNEWYDGLRRISAEASMEEWTRAIREATEAPEWDWTSNEAARRLTWDASAAAYIEVYRSVIS